MAGEAGMPVNVSREDYYDYGGFELELDWALRECMGAAEAWLQEI